MKAQTSKERGFNRILVDKRSHAGALVAVQVVSARVQKLLKGSRHVYMTDVASLHTMIRVRKTNEGGNANRDNDLGFGYEQPTPYACIILFLLFLLTSDHGFGNLCRQCGSCGVVEQSDNKNGERGEKDLLCQ